MSKKDYELIARVLRGFTFGIDENEGELLAERFADELRATNPRFHRERFIAACMGFDSHDSAGRKVSYSTDTPF